MSTTLVALILASCGGGGDPNFKSTAGRSKYGEYATTVITGAEGEIPATAGATPSPPATGGTSVTGTAPSPGDSATGASTPPAIPGPVTPGTPAPPIPDTSTSGASTSGATNPGATTGTGAGSTGSTAGTPEPTASSQVAPNDGVLKVSSSGRYLERSNGAPFLWLADTAWMLFHKTTREDADRYLQDRQSKGYNVIQAVALMALGGINTPNPYNNTALNNGDVTKPNEAYFQHVDYVINKATERGMFIALLPAWGPCWDSSPQLNAVSARTYGAWIGARYKDKNIIWVMGGDCDVRNQSDRDIADNLAAGIKSAAGDKQLMTYHPMGQASSSQKLHDAGWLNFNMIQSGHPELDFNNYRYVTTDRARQPVKPTLDGEARYENMWLNLMPSATRFKDFDTRQAGYWSMLAGGAGYTYGHNDVWQFYLPGFSPASWFGADTSWKNALNAAGSTQAGIMKRLFESRPWIQLAPAQDMIVSGEGSGASYVAAGAADDFAFVYVSNGANLTLKLDRFGGKPTTGWWFDPRTGATQKIDSVKSSGTQDFDPPASPARGNDWVLVLDAAGRGAPNVSGAIATN